MAGICEIANYADWHTLHRPRVPHAIEGALILYDLMAGQLVSSMTQGTDGISFVEALVEQHFEETSC